MGEKSPPRIVAYVASVRIEESAVFLTVEAGVPSQRGEEKILLIDNCMCRDQEDAQEIMRDAMATSAEQIVRLLDDARTKKLCSAN